MSRRLLETHSLDFTLASFQSASLSPTIPRATTLVHSSFSPSIGGHFFAAAANAAATRAQKEVTNPAWANAFTKNTPNKEQALGMNFNGTAPALTTVIQKAIERDVGAALRNRLVPDE